MRAARKEKTDEPISLSRLIFNCLEECKLDRVATAALLEKKLFEEQFKPYMLELLHDGIQQRIKHHIGDLRRLKWIANEGVETSQRTAADKSGNRGLIKLAETFANDLLEYPLIGFASLGDATREDIEEAIKSYGRQIRGTMRTIKWLRLISAALGAAPIGPDQKNIVKVRDVLSHENLFKMQIQADKE